jgi:glycosyltransferase involved in cell wall biosynthesis
VSGRVAVLLSTYNGARFLPDQLRSLLAQEHRDWTLFWRDDGSSDATAALLQDFCRKPSPPILHGGRGLGEGGGSVTPEVRACGTTPLTQPSPPASAGGEGSKCVAVAEPVGNLGVLDSFLTLLRAALPTLDTGDAAAFCDQDDVWLPHKLTRAVAALASVPQQTPALYCARQILVDANLNRLGLSPAFTHPPGFPASLTQNIATGCTILLNRAAASLIAGSRPPPGTLHDWWSFLLVTAAGGTVIADDEPALLYRQHAGNVVGARKSLLARALAAIRRGPGPFMADFRRHLDALASHEALLSPAARRDVAILQRAVARGPLARLAALGMPGLRRNRMAEGMLFRLWFVIG